MTISKSKATAPVSRVNAWVRTETLQKLQAKAEAEGTTVSELLRYAIGLSEYLEFMRGKGALVFVVKPDGSSTEILPRIPGEPSTAGPPATVARPEETRTLIAQLVKSVQNALPEETSALIDELVKSVQSALKERAEREKDPRLNPGEPDGVYGLRTKEAISALQARENLPVTGVVDPRTLAELVHA